jgi:hypothetical protein
MLSARQMNFSKFENQLALGGATCCSAAGPAHLAGLAAALGHTRWVGPAACFQRGAAAQAQLGLARARTCRDSRSPLLSPPIPGWLPYANLPAGVMFLRLPAACALLSLFSSRVPMQVTSQFLLSSLVRGVISPSYINLPENARTCEFWPNPQILQCFTSIFANPT